MRTDPPPPIAGGGWGEGARTGGAAPSPDPLPQGEGESDLFLWWPTTMNSYLAYVARRLGQFVLVVFIGINITFLITHATPIDPVEQTIAASTSFGSTSPEAIALMRQSLRDLYGLQCGLPHQYLVFWNRMMLGDFGPSLSAFPTPVSVLIWRALETAVREPVAVYAPPATGGVYNVRIAIRARVPGEARNAIAAAFGSLANVKKNKVEDLVTIKKQDIFELDLKDASVVTLYLLPELNVRLMPQLAKLKPGSRIVSHDFDMIGAKPKKVLTFGAKSDDGSPGREHTIYLWVVPWEKEGDK